MKDKYEDLPWGLLAIALFVIVGFITVWLENQSWFY